MEPFRLRIRGFLLSLQVLSKNEKLKKIMKALMYFDLQTLPFRVPKKRQFLNLGDQNLK